MKIVILDASTLSHGDIDLNRFNKYGELEVYMYTEYDEISNRIHDANVVICNKSLMDRNNIEKAKNLKYIGLFATGYNNVDIKYACERGITVCNAGSYSTEAVAQHVFAFILHKYSKVAEYDAKVKDGLWKNSKLFSPFIEMQEMMGKTIGIVGYGSIGKKVSDIAKVFGMKVLAFNRSKKNDEGVSFVDLNTLLSQSDIVTMHCPLNEESEKMCNEQFFGKMKKGAFFINTSRGGVVDEEALMRALDSEHLSGAALDVISVEPMAKDCKLCEAKNIIITPHAAWAPLDTRMRLVNIVEKNLVQYLEGKPINVINE